MRSILVVLFWCVCVACYAQSIHAYKSVHGDGSTTYSDTRPDSASPVERIRLPGTDAAIVEQGLQRQKEMDAAAERLEKQRNEDAEVRRMYESRVADARRALREAEAFLASVVASKKSATPERIAVAERKVELARARLSEVRRAGPRGDISQ